MADLIHDMHRLIRHIYPQLVVFRAERWGLNGLETDPHRVLQARLGALFSHRFFSRQYPGVPGRIHLNDSMLMNDSPEEIAHYIKVGESAIENIEAALAAAGKKWSAINAALDFPSGYGRVLRYLAREMEPGRITACELETVAVAFCAQEFGVRPLRSSKNLDALIFPETYDLIWVGSLFTHLPPEQGRKLLKKLAGQLAPGGLLIFSTQGPSCLARAEGYGFMFRGCTKKFEDQFAASGMAYLDYYPRTPGYGIAFYSPQAVRAIIAEEMPGCTELLYRERGWDEHQDVWTIRKGILDSPAESSTQS